MFFLKLVNFTSKCIFQFIQLNHSNELTESIAPRNVCTIENIISLFILTSMFSVHPSFSFLFLLLSSLLLKQKPKYSSILMLELQQLSKDTKHIYMIVCRLSSFILLCVMTSAVPRGLHQGFCLCNHV